MHCRQQFAVCVPSRCPVRAALEVEAPTNSSLVLTWAAGAFASYAPRTPEVVRFSLPTEATRSRQPLHVGQFAITVDAGSVSMSGSLMTNAHEAAVRSVTPYSLQFTLLKRVEEPDCHADRPVQPGKLRARLAGRAADRAAEEPGLPTGRARDHLRLDPAQRCAVAPAGCGRHRRERQRAEGR